MPPRGPLGMPPYMPWPLPEGDAEILALAKTYPYPAPGASYLFTEGRARPFDGAAGDPRIFEDRTPVIAHGSNRSPEQLARKYGAAVDIPVTLGWLDDHDVVFSAHMTRYGAIASTLQHLPGVRVRISITWLTDGQLTRMHETEGADNYTYGRLRGIGLDLEAGPREAISEAGIYLGNHGCLASEGAPIALAAVPAQGRARPAREQAEMLSMIRERYRPEMALDRMILDAVRAPDRRRALIAELRAEAIASEAPHFQAIAWDP